MTLEEWVRARRPEPPPALAARIAAVLQGHAAADAGIAATACLEAAERLLVNLLAQSNAGRECALDLLTVDALVTYAFEAASAEPQALAERAQRAMRTVARLGAAAAGSSAGAAC